MTAQRVQFASVTLVLPDGWFDITDELVGGAPPTLAKANGIGALQFSVARYESGPEPLVQMADLRHLLQEFSENHDLGEAAAVKERTGEVMSVSGEFTTVGELVRAWYVSNGGHVALVTYTTQEPHDVRLVAEILETDAIVASIDFS